MSDFYSEDYGSRYTPSEYKSEASYGTYTEGSYYSDDRRIASSGTYRTSCPRDVYPTGEDAPERLARSRVLYLGTSTTSENPQAHGVHILNHPLTQRIPDDLKQVQAIDAWLFILDNGVQIGYVSDRDFLIWIPIQNVHMVAAVKRKTIGRPSTFVPIDTPEADKCHSPPIFAVVTQRKTGLMECHTFICNSDKAAMALVKASTHAHMHKERWTKFPPARELLLINIDEAHEDLHANGTPMNMVHQQWDQRNREPSEYSYDMKEPLTEYGGQVDIPDGAATRQKRHHHKPRHHHHHGRSDYTSDSGRTEDSRYRRGGTRPPRRQKSIDRYDPKAYYGGERSYYDDPRSYYDFAPSSMGPTTYSEMRHMQEAWAIPDTYGPTYGPSRSYPYPVSAPHTLYSYGAHAGPYHTHSRGYSRH